MIRVYLDNCCYNRPYDDQSQLKIELETKAKLKIQEMIVDGKLELVSSYILEQENDDNPYIERKFAISGFFKYAIVDIDETLEIIEIALQARGAGLKVKDSLHLACAIVTNCDYLLTTDKGFLNYKNRRIRIVNPMQFILEMEGQ
ncbi:MAG: PIN domain-containing protein [Defluviitaleaceae bacterium]|nr:PIN domain-containing protein [Defluviitaleaceae bacterium]